MNAELFKIYILRIWIMVDIYEYLRFQIQSSRIADKKNQINPHMPSYF